MKLSPLVLPEGPVFLLVSVLIAIGCGRWLAKEPAIVERAIIVIVSMGLVVARLIFVLRYLPAYKDAGLGSAFDIRDLGFDLMAGACMGAGVLGWLLWRKRSIRGPLLAAAVAGVATWSTATIGASLAAPAASVPPVLLANGAGALQPLAKADGKPLVVNLWATWCPPCRAEMPALAQAQKDHPGVNIVFVNQAEPPEAVQSFLAENRLHIENLMFDGQLSLARAVGVRGYPTTLFYDAQGRLVASHTGGMSRATFEEALRTAYPALRHGS